MERKNPVNLRLSDFALQEIADQCEGFVGYTYDDKDPKSVANKTPITESNARMVDGKLTGPWGGTLTKGYGHTKTARPGDRITRDEALSLMRSDVRDAESCVHRYVTVPLTQGEFDGVTDLFYNVGPGTLPNAQYPEGKDGIACLGKSGNGRPSTLLVKLNEGDYAAAADCFTQWRMPGSVFEWGLLIRRIRFMLVFLGLPIVRAMMAMPNALPPTNQARWELVQKSIQLGREEAEDAAAVKPAPIPVPEPEPLVLDKPIPPSAAAPDTAGAAEAPRDPQPEASPLAPPPPLPLPIPAAPEPKAPVIPPERPKAKPAHVDTSNLRTENMKVDTKPLEFSDRAMWFAVKLLGFWLKIMAGRGSIPVTAVSYYFDFFNDPFMSSVVITGGTWLLGQCAEMVGSWKLTRHRETSSTALV